ncbi:cell division protein FtsQ/DivIB [Rhabdothermincola salaria]|uniref:cell division protein FtsQ/DivIB n=1 Tax=Rhabdothermincola salaria TaxID=2903142 RepID=UPI001E4F6D03|nr:FtsQ-type POTRA domain-containing protein [Rhabdothermincola salaria]MCD9622482.1 FtsQ-type POTRA domain-containing protein [Rhabdothermincola salaria]
MSTRTLDRPVDDGVDPRIAARRVAVAADRRRRRLRWTAWFLVAATAAAGVWYATHSSLLDVEVIRVDGATQTTPDEIRGASGVVPGDPLLWIDEGAAIRGIEALPWVASATVRRNVDGTVRFAVVERAAAVTVATPEGAPALVDGTGRVLAVVAPEELAAHDPPLVPVEGVTAPVAGQSLGPAADGALGVVEHLTPGLRSRLTAVRITPSGELELALVPDIVVELGRATELDTKLASLVTWLSQVDQTDLATVSMRVPELPTATRHTP